MASGYLDKAGLTYFWGKIKEYVTNAVKVTGVKGNSESSYRTGNVNITAANVGAVPTSRTVNGKALSSNITLKASDFFIFDTYSKSITVSGGATSITLGALTQHSGYTLRGYINQNGGYTDQWLVSYGTYGSNVVAMVYSKYNSSLTNTISCVAVWTKN